MVVILRWICSFLINNNNKKKDKNTFYGSNILLVRWDGKIGDSVVSSLLSRSILKSSHQNLFVITTKKLSSYFIDHVGLKLENVLVCPDHPSILDVLALSRRLRGIDTIIHPVGYFRALDLILILLLRPTSVFSLDDDMKCVNFKLSKSTKGLNFHQKYKYISNKITGEELDGYIIPERKSVDIEGVDILYNPFGSKRYRTISHEKSKSLLSEIISSHPERNIGILSSPQTKEFAEVLCSDMADNRIYVVNGVNTFYDAIDWIRNSTVILTVDTSIVHISSGLNKRLIAIYPKLSCGGNPWLPPNKPTTKIVFCSKNRKAYLDDFSMESVIDSLSKL